MQSTSSKPDKTPLTIKTIGAGVFCCIPAIWGLAIVMAKDRAVPIDVRGCYQNGEQTLQVQSTRIIVNGNSTPEIDVKYEVTNIGRQIEFTNGSWLELDVAKPP